MKLPASLYSIDQITSILWEIEDSISSARRDTAKSQLSKVTEQFLALNGIRDLNEETYKAIHDGLTSARTNAKQVHIVTGVISSSEWREGIIRWLRKEIDDTLFCSFATNMEQGGGIILRTPKRQYDLTLRNKILANKGRLTEILQK